MKMNELIATLNTWQGTLAKVRRSYGDNCDDRLTELEDEIMNLADRFRDGEVVSQ